MEIDSDLTDTGLGTDSIWSSASTTFTTGLEEEHTNPSIGEVGNSSKRKRKKMITFLYLTLFTFQNTIKPMSKFAK